MQIGIVAKKIGLSVDAIRFYERNGLLPRPPRTEGGFRRYAEHDVETLVLSAAGRDWIQAQRNPRTLRLRGNRLQPCAPVLRRLQAKLADVSEACRPSQAGRRTSHALRSCNKEMRKRHAHCPILR